MDDLDHINFLTRFSGFNFSWFNCILTFVHVVGLEMTKMHFLILSVYIPTGGDAICVHVVYKVINYILESKISLRRVFAL